MSSTGEPCRKCGARDTELRTVDGAVVCRKCTARVLATAVGRTEREAELAIRGAELVRDLFDLFGDKR